MNELNAALRVLVNRRDWHFSEGRKIDHVIKTMQDLSTSGVVIAPDEASLPGSNEYANMGIVEAARTFAKTVGRPLTSRELADGMAQHGWTTKSRNVTATIYATLANAKREWRRTPDGAWEYIGDK